MLNSYSDIFLISIIVSYSDNAVRFKLLNLLCQRHLSIITHSSRSCTMIWCHRWQNTTNSPANSDYSQKNGLFVGENKYFKIKIQWVLRLLFGIIAWAQTLNHKEVHAPHFNIISTINQPQHQEVNEPWQYVPVRSLPLMHLALMPLIDGDSSAHNHALLTLRCSDSLLSSHMPVIIQIKNA